MHLYILPARRHGKYAVYRGDPGDRPSSMGLHYMGSRQECEMFVSTHDADQLTRDVKARSDAYWDAVDARLSRRAGY